MSRIKLSWEWPATITVILALALVLTFSFRGHADGRVIAVDAVDRQEVLRYNERLNVLFESRNTFIGYLARKHGVDLKLYDFNMDRGEFVPKQTAVEEKK